MRFVSLLKRCLQTSHVRCRCTNYCLNSKLPPSITMAAFVEKQLHLLEIEHLAEVEEKNFEASNLSTKILQRKGVCIPKLVINSLETGLYNRSLATFSLRTINKTFPFNILSPGDIVKLNYSRDDKSNNEDSNGIVTKISDSAITVAFDSLAVRDTLDDLNQHGKSVALIKVANKVTYERLKHAMKDLSRCSSGPAKYLVDVLFGDAIPSSGSEFDISLHNANLNACQREAVRFALTQRELAIIHGPPGTGKTTTVIEIIAQLVKSRQKVLACAPSNVAVDNLLEKLSSIEVATIKYGFEGHNSPRKLKLVRLGHPARILDPRLQEMSLDALIYHSSSGAIIRDVRKDIDRIQTRLRSAHGNQQRLLYQERRVLMAELRKREKKAICDITSPADVVLATNVGAYPQGPLHNLPHDHFDVVVIDECGQALEAACWIPLMKARKCILAGDHLQLSPTIVSNEAAEEGLSLTLLERLIKLHGDKVVRMLTEQYRMHAVIMTWASKEMYHDQLTAHQSVEKHLLSDFPDVEKTENTEIPLLLVDTSGCEMMEAESEESDSKANEGEVKIVYQHVMSLIEAGVDPQDIAVVSPYNLQVDILRNIFHDIHPKLEVKSVDGFQGREKQAVILSLVRSNNSRDVGFLSDNRRLNVAVTRARRHIAVVCDSDTVSNDSFIKSLLDYVHEQGEVRSGFEYMYNEVDEKVDNVIHSFHLITSVSATSHEKNQEKTHSEKNSSQGKTKHGKTTATKQSRDHPVLDSIELELKDAYRDIINKYRDVFGTSAQKLGKNADEDISDALEIEVVQKESKIVFPSTLTSQERKVVHEICEEMSLQHKSYGEGAGRQVCVYFKEKRQKTNLKTSKTVTKPKKQSDLVSIPSKANDVSSRFVAMEIDDMIDGEEDEVDNDDNNVQADNETASDSHAPLVEPNCDYLVPNGYVVCDKCGKELPEDNLKMHSMHCERILKLKLQMEAEAAEKKAKKANVSSKTQKKTKERNPKNKDWNATKDSDELLDNAVASNRLCFYSSCSTKVSTIGQLCGLCKRTFCMSHHIPEVHGCGQRAKTRARKQIIRDGVLYPGSGVPDKKPPPDKRAVLKHRLNSKLKTMEESRKSKGNQKK